MGDSEAAVLRRKIATLPARLDEALAEIMFLKEMLEKSNVENARLKARLVYYEASGMLTSQPSPYNAKRAAFRMAVGGHPKETWKPTTFEAELLDRGIDLINSRSCRLQSNSKMERFHRNIGKDICHYESMFAYIEYYERLHWTTTITRPVDGILGERNH